MPLSCDFDIKVVIRTLKNRERGGGEGVYIHIHRKINGGEYWAALPYTPLKIKILKKYQANEPSILYSTCALTKKILFETRSRKNYASPAKMKILLIENLT